MRINKERAERVAEWVTRSDKFTFQKFAEEHKLLTGSFTRLKDIWISCPFQEGDSTPSCSCNDAIGKFHCFSCGRGGDYVQFVTEYDRIVLGQQITREDKLNKILKENPDARQELGFNSIFEKDELTIQTVRQKQFDRHNVSFLPSSYPELASFMVKEGFDDEAICRAVVMAQLELQPADIWLALHRMPKAKEDVDAPKIDDLLGG